MGKTVSPETKKLLREDTIKDCRRNDCRHLDPDPLPLSEDEEDRAQGKGQAAHYNNYRSSVFETGVRGRGSRAALWDFPSRIRKLIPHASGENFGGHGVELAGHVAGPAALAVMGALGLRGREGAGAWF